MSDQIPAERRDASVAPGAESYGIAAGAVIGTVNGQTNLGFSLSGAHDIIHAEYTLDLAPFSNSGAEDLVTFSLTEPDFAATLDTSVISGNHLAQVHILLTNGPDSTAVVLDPIWVFNRRGDVDTNGVVDGSDLAALQLLLGSSVGDAAYSAFADSDLDGRITESDAGAIGYSYGTGAVPPEIVSVTPTRVVTGEDFSLSAEVTGTGPFTYSWHIGSNGATPDDSTLPAPTLTAGLVNQYLGTLTVTSEWGSDTLEFVLKVVWSVPVAVIDMAAHVAVINDSIFSSAGASTSDGSTIVSYAWDFDSDGDTDSTGKYTNASYPLIGTYTVTLRVTDDYGEQSEATDEVRIITNPLPMNGYADVTLGNWGWGVSSDNPRLAAGVVAGKPVVAWLYDGHDTEPDRFYVAVALDATPTQLSDWRIEQVASGEADVSHASAGICDIAGDVALVYEMDGALYYGRYHDAVFTTYAIPGMPRYATIANIGGKPAVLSVYSEQMYYVYAASADPQSAAEWTEVQVAVPDCNVVVNNEPLFLTDVGGRAAFTGETSFDSDRRVVFATAAVPGADDWTSFTFDCTSAAPYACLFDVGGLPMLLFQPDSTLPWGWCYRGTVPAPTQASEWVGHLLPENTGHALLLDGKYIYGDGTHIYATLLGGIPGSSDDWVHLPAPGSLAGVRLVNYGADRPAYIRKSGSLGVVYRYPTL